MARKEYLPERSVDEVESESPMFRKFKAQFGARDAEEILKCGAHMRERTHRDDWFVDCIVVAVVYECMTTYHTKHEFGSPSEDYFEWIKQHVDFSSHLDDSEGATVLTGSRKKFASLGLI